MPPRRQLSTEDRGRALGLIEAGFSLRDVARRLRVSPSVICRLRERYQTTGTTANRPRSGRPRCTDRADDRFLVLSALRDRQATNPVLQRRLRQATHRRVSVDTIRRRLAAAGLRQRRPARRIPLSDAHRRARVAWCRTHLAWNRRRWAQVLFTDESRFCLQNNDGRIRVWRRQGERYADACVVERERFGGGSLMVWAGISLNGRTPLHLVEGTMTAAYYRDRILGPIVQPTLQAMGDGATLMDDNATPHRAIIIRDFLHQQNLPRMDWPARSPDLNPIENVWDILDRRVRANHVQPATLQQLFVLLQQEWAALPQATLRRCVESMRPRCLEAIQNNGGHTSY